MLGDYTIKPWGHPLAASEVCKQIFHIQYKMYFHGGRRKCVTFIHQIRMDICCPRPVVSNKEMLYHDHLN